MTVAQPEVRPAVERIELTGSFTARRAAQLSPRLSGLVETIDIDAGDQVAAGNVIVRLDDQLAELQLAQAEAAVAQSQASFDEAVRLRDEALRLGEDRFFPDTEIQARKSAVQVARAALDVARAERDTAAERLARHAIVAPFDGVIARLGETSRRRNGCGPGYARTPASTSSSMRSAVGRSPPRSLRGCRSATRTRALSCCVWCWPTPMPTSRPACRRASFCA